MIGGAVFALSLTLVGMAGLSIMGAVAPIGGLLMIAAWLVFAFGAFRMRPSELSEL